MNGILYSAIQRWKSMRNRKMLQSRYLSQYAFIGVGSHALQNLYPVVQYLGIPLKYVCCKSPEKLDLIERRFGVEATTSLDLIFNDEEIKGVFICVSPTAHYDIVSRVISSGKYCFVEKPPCQTSEQLDKLISLDKKIHVMVGMQKRYSPLIFKLKAQITKHTPHSYTMTYHTGAYPEGNPYTDLFIHPVDLAISLFGDAELKSVQRIEFNGNASVQIMLSHHNAIGLLDLSTAHSWSNPEESVRVNTPDGEFQLKQMERLSHYPHPKRILGMPLEKIGLFTASEEIILERNNFSPISVNNQLYTQGFISEIKSFVDMVEYSGQNRSPLSSLALTYKLLDIIQQ